jgi:serine/threonine protein kinase
MAIYRSNSLPGLFLFTLIFSAWSEGLTHISFPQFSANENYITPSGDVQYNAISHSFVMNTNSAATSTASCAILYGNFNIRLQDLAASFTVSFTFKFTTAPQQPVRDDVNTSDLTVGSRMTFGMANVWNYVGVAFSTEYNPKRGGPSNNFIGIENSNDNSTVLNTYNLCGNQTHCSYLANGSTFTAWIHYTPQGTLQVRLLNGSSGEKPLRPLFEYPNFELPPRLGEYVSMALDSSSTINNIVTHEVFAWSFNTSGVSKVTPLYPKKWVAWVLGGSGVVATLLFLCILFLCQARRWDSSSVSYPSGTRVFSYMELRKATKNFSESEKLGSGGFGTVYKGSIGDTLVAIKHINYGSRYAETTFCAEISSLGLIRHRNVVQLHGWCHEKGRLLLVYDYMSNGNLNEWLYRSGGNREHMAAALEYLHSDCAQCILHRDIKSSNVMLDTDFKAHLGDFGLARLMDHEKHDRTTMAAGTLGYMAPEMPYTGKATKESDVYSFGILVLEVVCGRQPLDLKAQQPEDIVLLHCVWQAQEAGALLNVADPRLLQTSPQPRSKICHEEPICAMQSQPNAPHSHDLSIYNMPILVAEDDVEVERTIKNLLHLGLMCCLPNPKARPTMGQVMQIMQQINGIDNIDCIITSMPPLPKTKPPGLYSSIEFSQTAEFSKTESSVT